MLVIPILAISVLLQFLSAFFAFRLIKVTEKTRSWILISAALFLMGVRRTITLFHLIFISGSYKSDPESEIVALFISFLMFLGVIMIRPLFIERRRNEEALQKSEDKFKYVFKHSILGKSITLPSGEISVNDALYEMLGYSPEELQNKKWQDITYPDDIELTQQVLDPIFSGKKESARFIKRYIHKNGSVIWGDVGTSVRRDEEGKPLYFITFISDITERKHIEDELARTAKEWQTTFDSTNDGIWILDKDQLVIRANNTAKQFFVRTDEEMHGKHCWDIVHGTTQPIPECPLLRAKVSLRREEMELQIDGCWLTITVDPILDAAGRYNGAVHIMSDITDRKSVEEALRESNDKYQSLFNQSFEGIYLHDLEGRIVEVNQMACLQSGYSRNELLKLTIFECHPSESNTNLPKTEILLQWKEWQYGQTFTFTAEHQRKDGKVYPVEISTGIVHYGDRNLLLAIVKDITERKLAEYALNESQQRFKNIINASPMGIHLYELNNENSLVFIGANPAANKILGVDNAGFVGKTIEEAFPGLIKTEVPARYKEAALHGTLWSTNQIEYNKDMITGAFEVVAFQIEPGKMAVIFKDVTEQKKIEEELRNYREHLEELVKQRTNELDKGRNMLRTLIDSLPDEIYAKDSESRFIMANSHVLHNFGRTSFSDIIGKTDFDFLPNEEAMKAYSKEHSVLQQNGHMINYEEQIMDTNWKLRWLEVTKVPMRDKEGRVTGLVGINRDVTEFKRIEENLQKAKEAAETANRAKSTFLSSMSHEIRTPMNAILGFSELMLHDKNLTADQSNWIKTINQSGEHLLALINDILEISRIEAGHITYNPSSFDLYALLHDLQAMFKIKTDTKHLTLLFEYSDDVPRFVVTDEGKLRQILINIIGNAVKFTQEGGIVLRIQNETEKDGKMSLMIEAEDTGPGIAEKDMEVLFQMFGQTETGIKEGGTGLGLAISQQYAKIMGGYITVKSKPGKGTCFNIKIDVLPGNKLTEKNHINGRVLRLKSGESYKVLIVDDRENNRKLLKDMLLLVGFTVEEAKNGQEAIKMFKTCLADIILMDMRMPVMDGYEAIRNIKSISLIKDKKIPIIAVTAGAFTEDKVKALEAGADMYLRKPFKEYELFECIKSCLGVQYIYELSTSIS